MRTVRAALIQASAIPDREALLAKHLGMIERAAGEGAEIICLQELFLTIYFGVVQDKSYFSLAEPVPGPTTEWIQGIAQRLGVVLIAPLFEKDPLGAYYNTAVVVDADGKYLGKYQKHHIPHREGFLEQFYFKPGDVGFPVFDTAVGRIGVFLDYDRHYPEVPRAMALKGALILFNPCTTTLSFSRYLWFLEQRAHAVTNGVFVATSNRVGTEPLGDSIYYGTSYFCDPFGEVLVQGSNTDDDVVMADLDLARIEQAREMWQFLCYRRPASYGDLLDPSRG